MLRNQHGFSVYAVLSIVLFVALVIILALPSFFKLDPVKNTEDCINNMKVVWVAATDYVNDFGKDFDGDLNILIRTKKLNDSKKTYLQTLAKCPESGKNDYLVYGKYLTEKIRFKDGDTVREELKKNVGVIVICPNLESYPDHIIPKAFYENMQPTQLQNYMTDDLSYIDEQTGKNGRRKLDALRSYIQIWKTDADAFNQRKSNRFYLLAKVFPEKPELNLNPE
ncbi:MAG: hypothetical protein PHI68_03455 [Candidatus Cloacimonetes bacterium]|nr:hypothetical protein [Candidatus Cloacimonadota bacterium]